MSVGQKMKIGDFVDGKRINEKTSDCVPFGQQNMQNVTHDQCLNAGSQNSKETSERFPSVWQELRGDGGTGDRDPQVSSPMGEGQSEGITCVNIVRDGGTSDQGLPVCGRPIGGTSDCVPSVHDDRRGDGGTGVRDIQVCSQMSGEPSEGIMCIQ